MSAWPDRYRVCSLGRAGRRALVQDVRTHRIVLELHGADQFEVADKVALALNESRMETPVWTEPEYRAGDDVQRRLPR